MAALELVRSDVVLALRRVRARPGFAASAILSIGLAVGASAVAFSIIDAVRLRALPLPDAERLVTIAELPVEEGSPPPVSCALPACSVSYVTYSQLLAPNALRSVSTMAAFAAGGKALATGNDSRILQGMVASETLFPLLGTRAAIGRTFTADDNRLGAAPVVLLSHALWTSQFGQDASILGRSLPLSDTRYTVIGVLPRGFDFEGGAQFWLPAVPALDPTTRPSITTVTVVARLADGATLDQLRAELSALALSSPRVERGTTSRLALAADPLRTRYVAATQGHDLLFLAIVGCMLVIACANVTNLLLARAVNERRAFSIRAALGARGHELARIIVVDHCILVLAGAALGLVLAALALPIVRSVDALDSFRLTGMDYRLDLRVVAFAVGVSVLVAVAISVVPSLVVLREDLQRALREHGAGATGGRRAVRVQRAFVVAQVACAAGLVVGGALVTKTMVRLGRVNLGFDAARLVQATPSFPHDWRVKETYIPLTRRIVEELRELPGVESTSVRAFVPIEAGTTMTPSGRGMPLTPSTAPAVVVAADAAYFNTLQVRLLRGRVFSDADREQTAPVAIVNESAAAAWWPDRDPLGETLRVDVSGGSATTMRVVGVVADNKAARSNLLLSDDGPMLYRPYEQAPSPFPSFFVRTSGAPSTVIAPVRRRLVQLVPNRPLSTQVVSDVVAQQLGGVRTNAAQLIGIAAVGLFLALVGVYGVLAYAVSRRMHELAIRRVLGASTRGVLTLVLGDAARLAGLGVVVGLGAARLAIEWMRPALYGTDPGDPVVYVATAVFAVLAAVAAACLPASRAVRASPQAVLRG